MNKEQPMTAFVEKYLKVNKKLNSINKSGLFKKEYEKEKEKAFKLKDDFIFSLINFLMLISFIAFNYLFISYNTDSFSFIEYLLNSRLEGVLASEMLFSFIAGFVAVSFYYYTYTLFLKKRDEKEIDFKSIDFKELFVASFIISFGLTISILEHFIPMLFLLMFLFETPIRAFLFATHVGFSKHKFQTDFNEVDKCKKELENIKKILFNDNESLIYLAKYKGGDVNLLILKDEIIKEKTKRHNSEELLLFFAQKQKNKSILND